MTEQYTASRQAFEAQAAANRTSASLLLFGRAMVAAVADKRLQRTHLRVLAAISLFMDHNIEAWPSRETIKIVLDGLSLKTVSNTITELRHFGYLVTTRRPIEKAGGKILTVYTFGNVDHEVIAKMHGDLVTEYVQNYRTQYVSEAALSATLPPMAAHDGGHEFPSGGELPAESSPSEGNSTPRVPLPGGNAQPSDFPSRGEHSPPGGNLPAKMATSSPPEGRRIESSTLTLTQEDMFSPRNAADAADARDIEDTDAQDEKKAKAKRRSQIDPNWAPTENLIQWVKSTWAATDAQIRFQAEQFRDYHMSKASTMADWSRAWYTWWRNEFHKIPRVGSKVEKKNWNRRYGV